MGERGFSLAGSPLYGIFFHDLLTVPGNWIEGTIYSEWSRIINPSFSEFTDFGLSGLWGELYMVSYAQEWCT